MMFELLYHIPQHLSPKNPASSGQQHLLFLGTNYSPITGAESPCLPLGQVQTAIGTHHVLLASDFAISNAELFQADEEQRYPTNRQGHRSDLTSDPLGPKSGGARSSQEGSAQVGEGATQIKRYIRLTELLPALLEGDIKVGNSNVGRATIIGTLI